MDEADYSERHTWTEDTKTTCSHCGRLQRGTFHFTRIVHGDGYTCHAYALCTTCHKELHP